MDMSGLKTIGTVIIRGVELVMDVGTESVPFVEDFKAFLKLLRFI